jgi:ABC-2 type transport system permease protein
MSFIRDCLLVFGRQMRLSLRNPAWLVIGLTQPAIYLAFLGPLLVRVAASNSTDFPAGSSWQFFVPGLLIQLGLFSASFVGLTIIAELRAGVIERLRVTPVSRLALLGGRLLRDVVVLLVQGAVLVAAGAAFGLRAPLDGILIVFGFMALLALSLAAASYAVGLVTKSEQVLAPLFNATLVPLMLLSGILLPMGMAPRWLNALSLASPFRYVVGAMRVALHGQYANSSMLEGGLVAVGLAVVFLAVSSRAFLKENA